MVKQVGYNASIAMTMTYDQQDAIVVQACKGIYKDAQNQIAQLMEQLEDLEDHQMEELDDMRVLESACEVLIRYHLNEGDYKKEMENG